MTKERFLEIYERNKGNLHQFCFEYYCEEKPQIPLEVFNQVFPIYLMMNNFGDVSGGYKKIEIYLKNKHGIFS